MKRLAFGRKLVIPLLIGVATAAVLIAYTVFVLPNVLPGGVRADGNEAHAAGDENGKLFPGPIYVVKERIVNVADPGARRYLKVGISLEFGSKTKDFSESNGESRKKKEDEFTKELAPKSPVMEDAITSILTSKSVNDLSTAEGKERLKTEIKDRLNTLLVEENILNVYFTQFIIQ